MDTSGRRYDFASDRPFVSASVIKVMLLTCFLNMKTLANEPLAATDRSELGAMIDYSDNHAADWVFYQVGEAHLYNLARRLGMRHFSVNGWWTNAELTTNDQALLMSKLEQAIYPRYYTYARSLLSSIVSWQSWGIPQVARPRGWKVFFKGGWRGTASGQLVHQVARLESGSRAMVICVMTDADPSQAYGEETIAGIAQRLLG
jgi:beta-lactamase class A